MDWTMSGRTDRFTFEVLSPSRKMQHIGWLSNVTGGSITWDWNSDSKVSGSIDVKKQYLVNNCLIRVRMVSELDGETKTTLLGTFFAAATDGEYDNGIYTGKVSLKSTLCRHTEDKLRKNFTLAKGKSAIGYYKKMFTWLGGWPAIHGVRDRKMRKTHVIEFGKTPMDALKYIAKYLDAEITVDANGKTIMRKKTAASKKPVSYRIPTDARSVTLEGVDISSTQAGTPNCVAVKFEGSKKYKVRYKTKSGRTVKKKTDGIDCAKAAAAIHHYMASHPSEFWYVLGGWGGGRGNATVTVDGIKYSIARGGYDCGHSVTAAWRAVLAKTRYAGCLNNVSWTGDMRSNYRNSGLFDVVSPTHGQAGDIMLNDSQHAAMCQSSGYSTFNNPGSVFANASGPGTPMSCRLHYNGKADTKGKTTSSGKKKAVWKTKTKTKKIKLRSVAVASPKSKVSRQNTGRWITETVNITNMHPMTQKRIDQIAKQKLKSLSRYTTSYTFKTFYLPIHTGEVVRFKQGKVRCDGLVTKIDMDLSPGGMSTVTIRKVRSL